MASFDAIDVFYIDEGQIKELISYFNEHCYRVNNEDSYTNLVMEKCIELVKLDYHVSTLNNTSGELCAHYPSELILMGPETSSEDSNQITNFKRIEPQGLRDLMIKARSARCRTRFPVPVIFYEGKYICRSATLSGGPEIYGRSGFDYFFSEDQSENKDEENSASTSTEQSNSPMTVEPQEPHSGDWILCDQMRKQDIKLLEALNVGSIVDLMVEKKKVKYGLNVSSSEKVDKENRYSKFTILSLPYPGCEFFQEFRDQNYSSENLYYKWDQTFINAEFTVPKDVISERLQIKWEEYKKWNLQELTENYLKLLLGYVFECNSGVLVHCISGWDRTPLFISMLRICLWADRVIHKLLTPIQMLYFTIAYDWLLFGHNLQDRKNKGEDIFYFCFHFLKFLMSDDFSFQKYRGEMPSGDEEWAELEKGDLRMDSHGSNCSLIHLLSSDSSEDFTTMPEGSLKEVFTASEGGGSIHSQQSSSSSSACTVIDVIAGLEVSHAIPVSGPSKTSTDQRTSSSESLDVSSWQHVSSTGSLKSTAEGSIDISKSPSLEEKLADAMSESIITLPDSSDPCTTVQQKPSEDHSQCGSRCAMRRERLDQIRKLFFTCYCQSIGHNLKDGSEGTGISNILGNIAGKIMKN